MGTEYYSFEKVLKELQLDEEELKRMVSEGAIRAFRDDDKMKFRRDDVDVMRSGRQTDPTIIMPGSGVEAAEGDNDIALVEDDTSETLLDLDEVKGGAEAETAVPAKAGGSADTLNEELVLDDEADLKLDDDEDQVGTQPMQAATQETFVDEDEEVGMSTEPLELVEEEEQKPAKKGKKAAEAEEEEGPAEKPKTVVASKRETVRAPARSARSSSARPAEISYLGWTLSIAACTLILVYGLFFFVDLLGRPGGAGGLTSGVAKMIGNSFFNERWEKDFVGKKASGGGEGGEEPSGDAATSEE